MSPFLPFKNIQSLFTSNNLPKESFFPNFVSGHFFLKNSYFFFRIHRFFTSFIFSLSQIGRFFNLVDTLEHKEEFKRYYRIPSNVSIQHCNLGEWQEKIPTEVVVISMIAFIKGGIRIPMDRITRDFLTLFRLCHTLCALNMFRTLHSVDAMNEKMGINLTHHDIN